MSSRSATAGAAARAAQRRKVESMRRAGRRWRLAALLVGPGLLTMIGENDGPSMISYAATGRTYGFGLFLPFIAVSFLLAAVVQEMCARVGAVTGRGYGELVAGRYGPFWGSLAAGDLVVTNFVTLVAELVAVRAGLAYFGVGAPVAVALGVAAVAAGLWGQRYRSWERRALGLAVFNSLFVAAAVAAHPPLAALAGSFATTSPLGAGFPRGQLAVLVASTLGATITPWMIFFQQGAVVDKGLGPADVGHGRLDLAIGTVAAALCAGGAYVAAAGAGSRAIGLTATRSLVALVSPAARPLFALGLVEAGGLALLTIAASGAYAMGECLGLPHSFDAGIRGAPAFYGVNLALPLLAGALVVAPGVPLLAIAVDSNVLATVLLPVTLVFLLLLANDRELMASAVNGALANLLGVLVAVVVVVAGAAAALGGLLQALRP